MRTSSFTLRLEESVLLVTDADKIFKQFNKWRCNFRNHLLSKRFLLFPGAQTKYHYT
jgi:hypothetical protein